MNVTLDRDEIDQAILDYLEKKGISTKVAESHPEGAIINFQAMEGHGHTNVVKVDFVEIYLGDD